MSAKLRYFIFRHSQLSAIVAILAVFVTVAGHAQSQDTFFYTQATVPSGPYAGRFFDTSMKRAIRILDNTSYEQHYGRPDGYNLIANFYHNKKFYVALVPINGVEKVHFLSEPFGGVFAHSMLRLTFSENSPIRLIAEVPEDGANFRQEQLLTQEITLKDIIITPEAVAPHGIPAFQAVGGFLGRVGVAIRVISLTGRGVSNYLSGKAKVVQYSLDLTPQERNQALAYGLRLSDEFGMKTMYNTLICNCNSLSFRILNSAKFWHDGTRSSFENILNWMILLADKVIVGSKFYPPLARIGLSWRRMLADGSLTDFAQDPEFIRLAETYPTSEPKSKVSVLCASHLSRN